MSANDYIIGQRHAVLYEGIVAADWGKGPNAKPRIDAANRAFCIWYRGMEAYSAYLADPIGSKMFDSLYSCGQKGWGWGVDTLIEAFEHYHETGGAWSDGGTTTYEGKPGKSYAKRVSDMPDAQANFLRAVDEKLPEMKNTLLEFQKSCDALSKLKPDDTSDLEKMNKHLGDIKKYASHIESKMWLLPPTIHARVPTSSQGFKAMEKVEQFADGATTWAGRSVKILDVMTNITDGVKIYSDMSAAMGGDRRVGLAFAGMNYALTFVPVLGSFYGEFLKRVPGLITSWREFVTDYHTRLDRASRGLDYTKPIKPPAWKCNFCQSTGGY
jgi:hypothetical protein